MNIINKCIIIESHNWSKRRELLIVGWPARADTFIIQPLHLSHNGRGGGAAVRAWRTGKPVGR